MRLRLAFACLAFALCGALAAGCVTQSAAPGVVTATPFYDDGPMPTYADPVKQHIVMQNTADALAWIATQEAVDRAATVAAVERLAVDAERARQVATQQVEQFNQQSTQQAISVNATATAAHLALQQQQAQVSMAATATVSAQRHADVLATQTAADALRRATEAQERARAGEWAELDRQAGFVIKLGLGMLAVVALAVLVYHAARWLSVIIAIDARRRLVLERAGLVFDNAAGEWKLLPGQVAPVLPRPGAGGEVDGSLARASRPAWLVKLDAKRAALHARRGAPFAPPDPVAEERRRRGEWNTVCKWFLLWSAVPARDGRPTTLSLRRMQSTTQWVTGQKLTRPDWEKCRDALLRLGVIEAEPGGSYVVVGGASAGAACHFPVWATSWPVPDGVQLPRVAEPPPVDPAVTSPAQHSTAHTGTHSPAQLHRPAQPENPPEFEILGTYASRVRTGTDGPDD